MSLASVSTDGTDPAGGAGARYAAQSEELLTTTRL